MRGWGKPAAAASLYSISLSITAVFAVLALPLFLGAEARPGGGLEYVLDGPVLSVLIALVLLGPLVEELIFRGWLPGSPRALFATLAGLAAVYGGAALPTPWLGMSGPAKSLLLFLFAAAAMSAAFILDNRTRLPFFRAAFPILFWGQGIAFGVLHFGNLSSSSTTLAILSTCPLVLCGWLWGYARVRLGLGWAVLLHAAYNVPAALGVLFLGPR